MGRGGVGTGKGTGKSMRTRLSNYPLADYPLVSPRISRSQKNWEELSRIVEVSGKLFPKRIWDGHSLLELTSWQCPVTVYVCVFAD